MKYWEAIKEITENPKKVFESFYWGKKHMFCADDNGYFRFEIYQDGGLIESTLGGGNFNGNIHCINMDWQEVKQPVTWQEAIQAGSKGRMVRVEFEDGYKKQLDLFNRNTFSFGDINNGTWYIED